MAEICKHCHRPVAASYAVWSESWHAHRKEWSGVCYAHGDSYCAEARDRWLTARVADLEAVIEAVRQACELETQPPSYSSVTVVAANKVRTEIAALLPPKGEPEEADHV